MSRPPLRLGEHGKIHRRQLADGSWEASCRVRDFDGKTRQVRVVRSTGRTDDTGNAAERALLDRLDERHGGQSDDLDGSATLNALYAAWKADRKATGRALTPQTWRIYEQTYEHHLRPAIGDVRIGEVRPGRVDKLLKTIHEHTPSAARFGRVVLAGMFDYAVRLDLIDASPMHSLTPLATSKHETKALTIEEVARFREAIREWQDSTVHGPKRSEDLLDIVDVMLGTGCRIGEVLALRWEDVDLEATPPTVTVAGTVVQLPGQGTRRQEHPKTATSRRTIALPRFAVAAIRHRQEVGVPSELGVIFPAVNGNLRSPNNVRRQMRAIREGAGLEWVTPHSFRKTVATRIRSKVDLDTASEVLGHSDTRVTRAAYIDAAQLVADVSEVLEIFGTGNESGE